MCFIAANSRATGYACLSAKLCSIDATQGADRFAMIQVAGHLEEMLSLAKSSEQYKQYMMGSMQDAMAPAPLDPDLEKRFHSGQFSVTIRELIAYYIAMVSLPPVTILL